MDRKSLDKAMEIFAGLITGERISKQENSDLYEAWAGESAVYEILDSVLAKSNLRLYEYGDTLYVTAGDQNRVFGYTNEELKRAIGLRLNRELYLAYFIIYNIMTLFYESTARESSLSCVRSETVIGAVTAMLSDVLAKGGAVYEDETEEKSFKTLALMWDGLPLVTDNEDLSSLKAARGSRTGFVKLVFNFLISQDLFIESAGQYYITDRMRALVMNYYDSCKGRLYEITAGAGEVKDAAY